MKAFFKRFMVTIKGFIIGSSMAVPGVSGGTMAIVLGIYDKLLAAINGLRKNFKENAGFLIKFGIGSAIGLVALYEVIGRLLDIFPIPVSCLFFGAVIGGIPTLLKKIKPEKVTASFCFTSLLWGVFGVAIVLGVANILDILKLLGVIGADVTSLVATTGSITLANVLLWIVTGLVVSIALILPGISTSHMLIILGITSILSMPLPALAIIGISLLVGIFAITKPLEWAMNRFTRPTYCVIIGFVIGSLGDIFAEYIIPGFAALGSVWWHWVLTLLVSAVLFVGGLLGLLYLAKFSDD
ncbi:MAG: DUF368 domain-containing protein [Clostridia bacterium]|nr:DUF368 domain-containing protein [Clostridia bacterium]